MTHAVIDAELLDLPTDFLTWVEQTEGWEALLADSPLSASWPVACRAAVYARWSDYARLAHALEEQRCPLGVHDIMRVLDALVGRLTLDPLPEGQDVVFDYIACRPEYKPTGETTELTEVMLEHLGRAAVRRGVAGEDVGVLTQDSSWSEKAEQIEVDGLIVLRQVGPDNLIEPAPKDAAVRELLHVWRDQRSILSALAQHPTALMNHLRSGIRAYFVGVMGGDDIELPMAFGPSFVTSVHGMGYSQDKRRAGALLRALAMIASGRGGKLAGHRERAGAGGNNPILSDADGYEVQRTYLAQNSPNAHRLFWVRRPVPYTLNVGGHDARPAL